MCKEVELSEAELSTILNDPEHKDLIDELVEFALSAKSAAELSTILAEYTGVPPRLVASALKYVIFPLLKKSGKASIGFLGKKAKQAILKLDFCQKIIKFILEKRRLQEWANKAKNCTESSITPEDFARLDYRQALEDINAAIDDLAVGQAELKEVICKMLEDLSSSIPVISIEISADNPFIYSARQIPYQKSALEKQLREIEEFISCDKKFTWHVVSGAGGTGKSRFVWELFERHGIEFCGGFLEKETEFNWHSWRPSEPTLIAIDYAGEYPEKARTLLSALIGNYEKYDYPVRVVLIEREGQRNFDENAGIPEWLRGVFNVDTPIKQAMKDTYYGEDKAAISLNSQYKDEDRLNDDIWEIIQTFAKGCRLDKAATLKEFTSIDSQKRPLFAAFYGEAKNDEKNVKIWNSAELVSCVISKNRDKYWRRACGDDLDHDMRALAIATLCGELNLSSRELPEIIHKVCPELGKLSDSSNRMQALGGNYDAETLSALEPDIVGELFVLKTLFTESSELKQKYLKTLMTSLWNKYSDGVASYFDRAFTDFHGDRRLRELFESADLNSFDKDVMHLWCICSAKAPDSTEDIEYYLDIVMKNTDISPTALMKIFANILMYYSTSGHQLETDIEELIETLPGEVKSSLITQKEYYLNFAAYFGVSELAIYLLRFFDKDSINFEHESGTFPLLLAAQEGHTEVVKELINAESIEVNKENKTNGAFPLLMAAQNGHTEVVKELINAAGIEVNKENKISGTFPLLLAAQNGHTEVVKELINAAGIEVSNENKTTGTFPLLQAAQNGHIEVVKELINAAGIDVNKEDHTDGVFPLLMAAQEGHTEVVKELISADGIDVNKAHENGGFPLLQAAQSGHTDVVKELINAAGIDVNKAHENGVFPLLMAAQDGCTEVVKELIKVDGIDVNKVHSETTGCSLLLAVLTGNFEITELLLQHGANPDRYIEKIQITVYEYAIDQGIDTCIIELLDKYRKR